MGDLAADTAVTPLGDGRFRAELSSEWDVWGPNGGYLAAIALRAAGARTALPLPASISATFLAVARFEPVDLAVTTLQRSRRAHALRVVMNQRGKPIVEATVWTVADRAEAPQRNWMPCPRTPAPEELPRLEDMMRAEGVPAPAMVQTCEVRLARWNEGGWERQAADPVVQGWFRFEKQPTFDDPWLDACRAVFGCDVVAFPAIVQAFKPPVTFFAPSLDLYVAFHQAAADEPWLLAEGDGLACGHGIVGGRARVWAPSGTLVASGAQQMLYRGFAAPA